VEVFSGGLRAEADVYFKFGLFILAGPPREEPKAKGERKDKSKSKGIGKDRLDRILKIVYLFHMRSGLTGWITFPLLKWIVPIQYEFLLNDLLVLKKTLILVFLSKFLLGLYFLLSKFLLDLDFHLLILFPGLYCFLVLAVVFWVQK